MLTDPRPYDRAKRIVDLLQSELPEEGEAGRHTLAEEIAGGPSLDVALLSLLAVAAAAALQAAGRTQLPMDAPPLVPDTDWTDRQYMRDGEACRTIARWMNGHMLVARDYNPEARPGMYRSTACIYQSTSRPGPTRTCSMHRGT